MIEIMDSCPKCLSNNFFGWKYCEACVDADRGLVHLEVEYCPCGNEVTGDYGICSDPKCK